MFEYRAYFSLTEFLLIFMRACYLFRGGFGQLQHRTKIYKVYIHVHTLFFITVNGQQGSRRGGAYP